MAEGPFSDPSCYHATAALLLRDADRRADPDLVLGNSAATAVRMDEAGHLVWENAVRSVAGTFARSDYQLSYHPIKTREDWRDAQRVMLSGRRIGLALDAYYTRHYWPGYRRIHALHVLALEAVDDTAGTVRVLDAGEKVYLDERRGLRELEPGLFESHLDRTDMGPGWMELSPEIPRPRTVPDPHALAVELAGTSGPSAGGHALSGLELTEVLDRRMEEHLRLVRTHPTPAQAEEAECLNGQWLLMGLWWYHHTLRWLGRHLVAAGEHGLVPRRPEVIDRVTEASTGFLVVRNLMMRLSVMDPDSARAATIRERLRTRLADTRSTVEKAGANLTRLA